MTDGTAGIRERVAMMQQSQTSVRSWKLIVPAWTPAVAGFSLGEQLRFAGDAAKIVHGFALAQRVPPAAGPRRVSALFRAGPGLGLDELIFCSLEALRRARLVLSARPEHASFGRVAKVTGRRLTVFWIGDVGAVAEQ